MKLVSRKHEIFAIVVSELVLWQWRENLVSGTSNTIKHTKVIWEVIVIIRNNNIN